MYPERYRHTKKLISIDGSNCRFCLHYKIIVVFIFFTFVCKSDVQLRNKLSFHTKWNWSSTHYLWWIYAVSFLIIVFLCFPYFPCFSYLVIYQIHQCHTRLQKTTHLLSTFKFHIKVSLRYSFNKDWNLYFRSVNL